MTMPLYYFDTVAGVHEQDGCGVTLPNDDAARLEAIRFVGASLADRPTDLTGTGVFRVEVRNDRRELLFMITSFLTHDVERDRPGLVASIRH